MRITVMTTNPNLANNKISTLVAIACNNTAIVIPIDDSSATRRGLYFVIQIAAGKAIKPKPKNPTEPNNPASIGVTPRSSAQTGTSSPNEKKTNMLMMSMPHRMDMTTQAYLGCGSVLFGCGAVLVVIIELLGIVLALL